MSPSSPLYPLPPYHPATFSTLSALSAEDINVWMFAMVGVGSAFVVFVVISMYLLW